jgi:hypothetical protein
MAKQRERKKRAFYQFVDLEELKHSKNFAKAAVIGAGGFSPLQARRFAEMKCGFELPEGRFRAIPIALWRRMCRMPKPHRLEDVPDFARPKEIAKKNFPKPLKLALLPRPKKKKPKKTRTQKRRCRKTNPNQLSLFP